jgi:hypothetical protein
VDGFGWAGGAAGDFLSVHTEDAEIRDSWRMIMGQRTRRGISILHHPPRSLQ